MTDAIDDTRYLYPKWAAKGWVFVTNTSTRTQEEDIAALKWARKSFPHYGVVDVVIDYNGPAYGNRGQLLAGPTSPVFARLASADARMELAIPMSPEDGRKHLAEMNREADRLYRMIFDRGEGGEC